MLARSAASKLESGSSNKKPFGSRTIALPIATRCRCPPDNCFGSRSNSGSNCKILATCWTRLEITCWAIPAVFNAKPIFSLTVICGYSAYDWNTIERPRSDGNRSVTSASSIKTEPESASSRPAKILRSVDLPHPDGPTNTTSSPSLMSRSMPLMTCRSLNDF